MKRKLLTLLATAFILGGLIRLALDDAVAEVALPDSPAAGDAAPLVPESLAALAVKR